MKQLLTACMLLLAPTLFAQNNIAIGNNAPDSSARLDVQSSTQGLLIPRLTSAQRNAMPKKAVGLLVYDTDKQTVMMYNGSSWSALLLETLLLCHQLIVSHLLHSSGRAMAVVYPSLATGLQ